MLRLSLSKNRIVRHIAMLAGSTALAQVISICAMPFVTRIYSPQEIGIISLFMSFFGFWASTLSLRYEYALLIASDDAESHVVLRLATISVVVMSLVGVPILWVLQKANWLEFAALPAWAPLIVLPILLGHGMFMVYRSWALRGGLIRGITNTAIARAGANAVSKIGFGALGWGTAGLFMAELAGACTSMVKLAGATKRHFAGSRPASINRRNLAAAARKFSKFPKLETPSAWLDALALTLPLPLVATLYGTEAAGWFGLARMAVGIPNSQIGAAVADVFQMELAKAVLERDGARAHTLFFLLMKKMAWLGLLPLVGTVALLPWLFPIIFGEKWRPAGEIAAALAPWLYAAFIVSPLSRALSVLQAQEMKLIYDTSAVVLIMIAFLIGKYQELSLLQFCLVMSAAKVIGYAIYALVLTRLMHYKLPIQPAKA